jgi:hypothetical protein
MIDERIRFVIKLKRYKHMLYWQTYRTLRGQALSGDVKGAEKGLKRLLNEKSKNRTRKEKKYEN